MLFQDKLCPGALCAFIEVVRPGANIYILSWPLSWSQTEDTWPYKAT